MRMGQRVPKTDHSMEALTVVLGLPGLLLLDLLIDNGRVEDDRGRAHPLIDGRRIDNRLEGRPWLPMGLNSAIVFAAIKVVASNHRADCAFIRIEGDQSSFNQRSLF